MQPTTTTPPESTTADLGKQLQAMDEEIMTCQKRIEELRKQRIPLFARIVDLNREKEHGRN